MAGIAQAIGNGWEILAAELGIPQATLEHIKIDHRFSTVEQIYYMLVQWRKSAAEGATLDSLFEALRGASPSVTVNWKQLETKLGFNGKCCEYTYIRRVADEKRTNLSVV